MLICRTFFLLLLLSVVSAVNAQEHSYSLNAEVNPELKAGKIFLKLSGFIPGKDIPVKEINILNGKFSIEGVLDEPLQATISLTKEAAPGENTYRFILDRGSQTIRVGKPISASKISGSKTQDDMDRYSRGMGPFNQKWVQLNEEAVRLQASGLSQDSVWAKFRIPFKQAQQQVAKYQLEFIQSNTNSYLSLLLIPELAKYSSDFNQADSLFQSLHALIRQHSTAGLINEYIQAGKPTSIGSIAPDFTLPDTTGKALGLSSVRGKYVLLDFWAAWCGPCRQENPNVVDAFERFQDKGFTVFGVSLDRDKKDWLKAIRTDRLTWPHVSDLKFWQSKAALLYGITSIPRNFLLDPQGKIIGRDLRGPDLIERLQEIFPE